MIEFGIFVYFVCGNGEVSGRFRWRNLRERNHLEDLDVEDKVIYIYILLTAIGLSPGGSTHLHTNNT